MKAKIFISCWLSVYMVMLTLNGLFHAQLAAGFFDHHLQQLQPAIHPLHDTKPAWVLLLDLVLTFAMTYFIVWDRFPVSASRAAFTGALLNLVAAGAWNFANAAIFDWSNTVTAIDLLWHISLGAAGGWLMFKIYYWRFANREPAPIN